MQYKTTIEVVTEADSEYEAADIAGEFLQGNLNSGADIRVRTISAAKARRFKAIAAGFITIAIAGAYLLVNKISYKIASVERKSVTSYAIQPSLRTNLAEKSYSTFKEVWEKEAKDRINSITR